MIVNGGLLLLRDGMLLSRTEHIAPATLKPLPCKPLPHCASIPLTEILQARTQSIHDDKHTFGPG